MSRWTFERIVNGTKNFRDLAAVVTTEPGLVSLVVAGKQKELEKALDCVRVRALHFLRYELYAGIDIFILTCEHKGLCYFVIEETLKRKNVEDLAEFLIYIKALARDRNTESESTQFLHSKLYEKAGNCFVIPENSEPQDILQLAEIVIEISIRSFALYQHVDHIPVQLDVFMSDIVDRMTKDIAEGLPAETYLNKMNLAVMEFNLIVAISIQKEPSAEMLLAILESSIFESQVILHELKMFFPVKKIINAYFDALVPIINEGGIELNIQQLKRIARIIFEDDDGAIQHRDVMNNFVITEILSQIDKDNQPVSIARSFGNQVGQQCFIEAYLDCVLNDELKITALQLGALARLICPVDGVEELREKMFAVQEKFDFEIDLSGIFNKTGRSTNSPIEIVIGPGMPDRLFDELKIVIQSRQDGNEIIH